MTRSLALAVVAPLLLVPAADVASVAPADERAAPALTVRAPRVVGAADPKTAVLGSGSNRVGDAFTVVDAEGDTVLTGELEQVAGSSGPWSRAALADFSAVTAPGTYRVVVGSAESAPVQVLADPYPDLMTSLLGIYDANRDGAEESSLHGPSHLNDRTSKIRNGPDRGETVDVRGGWMDSGDQLKFTVTIGYAATMLQLALRNEPAMADELADAAGTGVRWLRRAHPRKGVFVSMVGDVQADHNAEARLPTADDGSDSPLRARRPSTVLTRKTRGADVAGVASAALALAAQRASGTERRRLVKSAKEWYAKGRDLEKPWRNCCYQQDTARDDLGTAAVQLWRATGDDRYRKAALRDLVAVTGDGADTWRIAFDGYEMAGVVAAELCGQLGLPAAPGAAGETACRILRRGGEDAAARQAGDAFGLAASLTWGTVRQDLNGGLVALLAGRAGLEGGRRTAHRALGWFLGTNPWGVRFQVGVPGGAEHPHHWAHLLGPGLPVASVVGGPAPRWMVESQFGAVDLGPFDTDEALYRDVRQDYVTNEVGIPYNSPGVLLVALLSEG